MGTRTYLLSIYSDNTIEDRTYVINHRSAMKAAEKYGKAEPNETITVRLHSGQILSRVKWDPQSSKYINVNFE